MVAQRVETKAPTLVVSKVEPTVVSMAGQKVVSKVAL